MRVAGFVLALSLANGTIVSAHVTVWPRESRAGSSERYTVRVPTEGKVATTSVQLEIPAGVTVTGVLVPNGYTYKTKREGDRIVSITWKQEIKPGEYGEFVFFARNPKRQRSHGRRTSAMRTAARSIGSVRPATVGPPPSHASRSTNQEIASCEQH